MNDTTATTCTCPSGDGSLRHPCPTHPLQRAQAQPAAAQEAVACQYPAPFTLKDPNADHAFGKPEHFRPASVVDALGATLFTVSQRGEPELARFVVAAMNAYAAPVAAAPTDEDYSVVRASTPAAPGIDLRGVVLEYIAARDAHELATRPLNSHAPVRQLPHGSPITRRWADAREALRLAMIDASPKGASFDVDLFVRDCCEAEKDDPDHPDTICISVDALTVIAHRHADANPKGDVHPDDLAVDTFAAALKEKLAAARAKGRGGWNGDEPGMQQRLSDMLREHVEKGDPRDVANFCMFLHQRGEGISPKGGSDALKVPDTDGVREILGRMCFQCIRIAQVLRLRGDEIKERAEDEQAAVLRFLLNHYLASPDQWAERAQAEINAIREQAQATSVEVGS